MPTTDEDRYEFLIQKGELSEIPTRWLHVFLKRSKENLTGSKALEATRNLQDRIKKIKEELAWRDRAE